MIQMQINVINNHQSIMIDEQHVCELVKSIIKDEELNTREINVIFVHDDYLRRLHKDYLNEDSYTDVMSFTLGDDTRIEAEIYISLDRAKIHATELKVPFDSEIARLIIHGLLHLKGYDDQTNTQRKQIRNKEEHYLNKYFELLHLL